MASACITRVHGPERGSPWLWCMDSRPTTLELGRHAMAGGPHDRRLSRVRPGLPRPRSQRQASRQRAYSIDTMAADVDRFLEHLGRSSADYLGYSMGPA